jgi:hypothetical protein
MIASTRIPIITRPQGYYLRWYFNGWHYWQFFAATTTFTTAGQKYRTTGTRSYALSSGLLTAEQCKAVRTVLNTREVYIYTDAGWQLSRIEAGSAEIGCNYVSGYEIAFVIVAGSRLVNVSGYSPVQTVPVIPIPFSIDATVTQTGFKNITLSAYSETTVSVIWGDGSIDLEIIGNEGSAYTFTHTYLTQPRTLAIVPAEKINYIQAHLFGFTSFETLAVWRNIDLIDLQDNALTDFIIYRDWFGTTMSGIYLNENALTVDAVNALLIEADASALTSGNIILDSGTNAAPTGAGITAKNSLIAKGLNVVTN